MGWAERVYATGGQTGTQTTATVVLNGVVAGDLIVIVACSSHTGVLVSTIADDDGNDYTTVTWGFSDTLAKSGWAIAKESGNVTITVTWDSAEHTGHWVCAAAFNPNGDTISVIGHDETACYAIDTRTAGPLSGTQNDVLAFGQWVSHGEPTVSELLIVSGAPDTSQATATCGQWWKIYTGGAADIDATVTVEVAKWLAGEIVMFELTAGGGGSIVPIVMAMSRRLRG